MPDQQNPALEILGQVYGGHGGSHFDDRSEAASGPITQITLQTGSFIDAISLTYGTHITWHGGPGGQPQNLTLGPGEYITHVEGRAGHWIDSLKLTTNRGQTIQGGGHGGHHFVVPNPNGLALHTIVGRAGNFLDQIQFVFGPPPSTGKVAAAPKARKAIAAPAEAPAKKAVAKKPAAPRKSPEAKVIPAAAKKTAAKAAKPAAKPKAK